MKTKRTIITLVAMLLVMVTSLTTFAASTNKISFTVEASASTVKPGDTVSVTLSISESTGFMVAGADVKYDSTALTYVNYTVGKAFAADSNVTVTAFDTGKLIAVNVNDKKYNTVNLTGELVVLNFKVNEGFDGETTITSYSKDGYLSIKDASGKATSGNFDITCGSTTIKSVSSGHVHTYGTLVAEVAATCEADGKAAYYKCSVCGKFFDKDKNETTEAKLVIAKKGHTEVVDAAVAATCETAGKTEGKHCSVCNKVLVAQEVVPATGHTVVKDAAIEESCITDGKTAGSHCSVCKKVLVAQKRIPATGHTPGPEATCTEPQKCKVCGKNLGQAKGHTPGAAATCTEGQKCTVCGVEIAPAKGHTYGPGASCTEAQKCTVCGAELAPKANHTPGAAATCTEAQKCTVCGTVIAPAKGHTPGAAATCVKAQKCTVCGAEIAPATGKHTPGAAATCTEAQKCTVCGAVITPAKGHTPVVDEKVEPTLSKEGKTEGSHCSVCGEVIIAQQAIAKKSALWIYITVGVVVVIGAAVVVAVVISKKRKADLD